MPTTYYATMTLRLAVETNTLASARIAINALCMEVGEGLPTGARRETSNRDVVESIRR